MEGVWRVSGGFRRVSGETQNSFGPLPDRQYPPVHCSMVRVSRELCWKKRMPGMIRPEKQGAVQDYSRLEFQGSSHSFPSYARSFAGSKKLSRYQNTR